MHIASKRHTITKYILNIEIYAAMSNILMCVAVINAAFYSDLVYLCSSPSEYERKNPIINNGIEYKLPNPYLLVSLAILIPFSLRIGNLAALVIL